QAIVDTVAHVDEPVVGGLGAVHRVAELLRGRVARLVGRHRVVGRRLAVGAPGALELQRLRVPDRDAVIAVAVGRDELIGLRIEADLGHATDVVVVHAALAAVGPSDLSEVLARLAELQDEAVVIGDLTRQRHAGLRPRRRRGAPGDGWRSRAARRGRELCRAPRSRTRLSAAIGTEPDVAFAVDRDAVIGRGPVVAFDLAPVLNQVPGLI